MNPAKPGWKSSEFWITISSLIISVLIGFGTINSTDGDQLTSVAGQLITSIVNAVTILYYIKRRSDIKQEQVTMIAQHPELCTACGQEVYKKESKPSEEKAN